MRRFDLLLCAALGLSSAVCTRTARAQSDDGAVAQALFDQAKALMAKSNAAEACPKLEESQRLDPRSGTLINLASCYELTGRLASAWSTYIAAATSAKEGGQTQRETVARERASALAPRLSKLTISVPASLKSVPGLEITRDGSAVGQPTWGVPLPCDPGVHRVAARAPGRVPFEITVTVNGEAKSETVNVPELEAAPSASSPTPTVPAAPAETVVSPPHPQEASGLGTQRTAALVIGGVGLVGVGVGTVFGLASKSKHDEAAKACPTSECSDAAGVAAGDAARSRGNVSTVAMIVGVAGLATGVTLWLTAPTGDPERSTAHVGLGLGSVQLGGTF